jgi:molybdopterin-guanine dinucleotide biosynthesis protein A
MAEIAAIVLAGGRSTRMGQDKASLVLGDRTLLHRAVDAVGAVADDVVVVLRPGAPVPVLDMRAFTATARPEPVEGRDRRASARPALTFVDDEAADEGPLVGITSGLAHVRAPVALVVACDQPFVRPELLRLLAEYAREHTAVVPVVDGLPQPMCSAVRTEVLPQLRALIADGSRAASELADLPGALLLSRDAWAQVDPDGRSFIGVNTPEELAQARALLASSD